MLYNTKKRSEKKEIKKKSEFFWRDSTVKAFRKSIHRVVEKNSSQYGN